MRESELLLKMVSKQGIGPCLSSLATSTVTSHKEKCEQQIEKLRQRGLLDRDKVDAFSLFLESSGLTPCLYKNTESILGNTFGMCILQDFEALTPNLLARTIETVEGGGLVVLLLRSLSSLTSLYTMVMDVHERFRTESHIEATGRFNERFLLSLASCKACVFVDDELNILPVSSHVRSIAPVSVKEDFEGLSKAEQNLKNIREQLNENLLVGPLIRKCSTLDQGFEGLLKAAQDLKNLKEQLNEILPIGPLIKKCCTLDQGKAFVTFMDAILEETNRGTVALLAARGRGKSATLGLSIAGAIAVGYSNIFVTAPSPKNLKTLFEFVCKGFDALDYKENFDFDVVKSLNPKFKKAITRINIYKHHRQTIQYILPHEHEKLSQVDLLVVDEAAAIPLPVVRSLLGSYLVFLSSTVNGYEGTGRSLSLKLLHQLEKQSNVSSKSTEGPGSGRPFKKIELSESIRYASGDPIESWLNTLLCLDVSNAIPTLSRLPPRNDCDLYYVNRDTLFSYHKDSETFLQRMMALYVASHYKNSPNDLQLMADAPAHHLFVLLGPVDESKNQLPDILCVIQVCLEGKISRQSAIQSLSNGHKPFGDQIPWKFCEQFRETVFPSLSGARIVRIATHPSAMRLGYGSRAVELLIRYYEGQITPISEIDVEDEVQAPQIRVIEAAEKVSLLEENIKPRTDLPHLLVHLRERRPEKLLYIGVSFGLTLDLFCFWRKLKFAPFYIGQIPNTVTGEYSCMVLKALNNDEIEVDGLNQWDYFGPFYQDFRQRFIRLLSSTFRGMEFKLAMSIIDPKINFTEQQSKKTTSDNILGSVREYLSPHDMKRLEAYVDNLADFHLILDLVPILTHLYFQEKLPVKLSYVQASVLLCIGLQNQNISYIQGQMKLERQQILSEFIKIMKKFYKYLYGIESKEIESTLPRLKEIVMEPHSVSVDEDLNNAAKQVEDDMKSKAEATFSPELLQRYAVEDGGSEFENALKNNGGKIPTGGLIGVISSRNGVNPEKEKRSYENGKKRRKDHDNHKLSKRRS
ncbi:N-acetyltransferase protein [Spatholobus suberectus]|nr:N-acetyltransferase protein [Spatholobus suberectus]